MIEAKEMKRGGRQARSKGRGEKDKTEQIGGDGKKERGGKRRNDGRGIVGGGNKK